MAHTKRRLAGRFHFVALFWRMPITSFDDMEQFHRAGFMDADATRSERPLDFHRPIFSGRAKQK
jgi:hypothetical protein